jgi:glycosyltransferase involved in cell wall biosynthesis
MRLAMILSTPMPPAEGIGYYVWNLAQQLKKQGHAVQIITRGSSYPTWSETVDGIRIWHVTFFPIYPFHVHIHTVFVKRLIDRLADQLDLLHLHSPLVGMPTGTIPSITTVHSPTRSGMAVISGRSWYGLLAKLQAPFSFRIEKRLFERSDRIVVTSSAVAKELAVYGISDKSVGVLGNGVDVSLFSPSTIREKPDHPYVLTAGRLSVGKGLEDLADCVRLVVQQRPDVLFLVAGSGPLEPALRRLINQRGLGEKMILLGQVVDRRRLRDLYRNAAVFVHPSLYEGLPTVILEAMACARPVVATAVGGTPDLIENDKTGFLVPPHKPAELADAILHFLVHPDFAKKVGTAGRKTILQRYSWEAVSRSYIGEYSRLLETGVE